MELLVADALAACGTDSAFDVPGGAPQMLDPYLASIRKKMADADCDGPPQGAAGATGTSYGTTLADWVVQRKIPACNRQPGGDVAASIDVQPLYSSNLAKNRSLNFTYRGGAPNCNDINQGFSGWLYQDIHYAALNACVAHRLRFAAPGSAGAESLLLSAAEQRSMLEVVRERAQVALVQYSRIGTILSRWSDSGTTCAQYLVGPQRRVGELMQWRDLATGGQIEKLAEDFASTLQIHTQATEDFLDLLHRSSSARAQATPAPGSLPDQYWGPGSWSQRALALAYGGDPLATDGNADALWHQTVPVQPDWPGVSELPYVRTEVRDPQVLALRQLARECDVLDLDVAVGDSSCPPIDRASSSSSLYRKVEACLRTKSCVTSYFHGKKTFVCGPVDWKGASLDGPHKDYDLWKTYRIAPEHAEALVGSLADSVEPMCSSGVFNVDGMIRKQPDERNVNVVHLDAKAVQRQKPLAQIGPLFTQKSGGLLPWGFFPDATSSTQGFPEQPAAAATIYEGRRLAGAVSTQVAVRDAIISGVLDGSGSSAVYFAHAGRMMGMTAAAIGDRQVIVRPDLDVVNGAVVQPTDGFTTRWTVDVDVPMNDPWWELPGPDEVFVIQAKKGDPNAAAAALGGPGTSIYGETLNDVANDAQTSQSAVVWDVPDLGVRRFRFVLPITQFYLPGGSGGGWTLIAERQSRFLTPKRQFLADNVSFSYGKEHFIAEGGRFGKKLKAILRPDAEDASKPQSDAFGVPMSFFPPVNPAVLDKTGPTAATYYLDKAKVAADEATAAVQIAFEHLMAQEADEAAQIAATLKAKAVAEEQKKTLCGASHPDCSVQVLDIKLATLSDYPTAYELTIDQLWPNHPLCLADWAPESGKTKDGFHCALLNILHSADTKEGFKIAKQVWDHRADPGPPAFNDLGGGALQGILLRQWNALKQMQIEGQNVVDATKAADARADAMDVQLIGAKEVVKSRCKIKALDLAVNATLYDAPYINEITGSDTFASAGGSIPVAGAALGGGSKTEEKKKACMEAVIAEKNLEASAFASAWEAVAGINSHTGRFMQTLVDLRQTSADLQVATLGASLATERAALDAELTAYGLKTGFGVYRRYHEYDLWRAKAMLESARRQAVIARRAVEAQLLVDLSTLTQDEPFVAKPASWADEIYSYDLDVASAVGLAVADKQDGAIYPNKLKDYVGNLDKFVQGYALARPWATANVDSDIVNIPGPNEKVSPSSPTLDARAFAWTFLCGDNWVGLPAGGVSKLCPGAKKTPPTRARISFSLDPWARLNASIASEPYAKRVNTRWGKLAVNLVGTGILDCTKADDPAACYSQSFVRYDLTQSGAAWTKSYDDQWKYLRLPVGRIEAGKALTAEEWLDPVSNGWSKPFVEAVARSEFVERPTDGTYVLEIELAPEVRPDHIERVQVLQQTSYWVKQK